MYVTSLDGELIYATCIKPDNEENPDYAKMLLQPHAGAVAALQRSPFFNDLLLTVGDWTFQIWREGSNQPLFVSPYGGAPATGARSVHAVPSSLTASKRNFAAAAVITSLSSAQPRMLMGEP